MDVNRVTGSLITFDAGLLASTDDLRALMDHTMTEAIDQALDKPEFIAAAHGGS